MTTQYPSLSSIPVEIFLEKLESGGLVYRVGPFDIALTSDAEDAGLLLKRMYADSMVSPEGVQADFRIAVKRSRSVRRWVRPLVNFFAADTHPFPPHPLEQAFPLIEWGLNWCVATTAHHYLMLHAAVVEKGHRTLLMPALPGSGKSTLCAALVHRGWRLLSDEFGLVRYGEHQFVPFPRCIPLKNESVEIIRDFAPDAVLGPVIRNTRKGDVAHLKPPSDSMLRGGECATVSHVIFPQYTAGADAQLIQIPKAQAFMRVCSNSFNYELAGVLGFRTVAGIIDTSDCFIFEFSELDAAVAALDELAEG